MCGIESVGNTCSAGLASSYRLVTAASLHSRCVDGSSSYSPFLFKRKNENNLDALATKESNGDEKEAEHK